jgi:SAM-dependent methyltransferase
VGLEIRLITKTMTTTRYVCKWCADAAAPRRLHLAERMFGDGGVHRYDECGACGSLQLAEVPADMSPHYPAHYMAYTSTTTTAWKRWARSLRSRLVTRVPVALGRRLRAPWILQALHGRFPPRDTRILDVGCGTGAVLDHLADAGYSDLTGLEPYLDADRHLPSGVVIRRGTLESMAGHFAFIMSHHSMEHMEDPVAALTHLRRLLSPGGKIWVRVPLMGGAAWQKYESDWVQLDPPRHLCIPSIAGMTAAVKRAGLRIIDVDFDSSGFQFWGSELARRKIPLVDPFSRQNVDLAKHFSPAELKRWTTEAEELNLQGQGDQVGFWLSDAL